MSGVRFGTDGVRGRAFDEVSTDLAFSIGRAAAVVLDRKSAVVGRDTRASGPALRDALVSGMIAGGAAVVDLGIAPTPAVAFSAARRGAFGAMISASHNPWFDNGIKLFTGEGSKLSDGQQLAIEALLEESTPIENGAAGPEPSWGLAQGDLKHWLDSVVATVQRPLTGLRVVVDAANGAASHVVGPMLRDQGVDVAVISNTPDGQNINAECGSTHPEQLGRHVLDQGADVGLALDGDADRLLCVDHTGRVIDGDPLMAIIAKDLFATGRLSENTVVVTVMSNLGFHKSMAEAGIDVQVTPVGDRHVLEALSKNRWSFGGEQSGHLIFGDDALTGDGCLTALRLLDVMVRLDRPLAELADSAMTSFPQVMRNVRVLNPGPDPAAAIAEQIEAVEDELAGTGRVLIRASGTEPVVRVMVEAASRAQASRAVDTLCAALEDCLGV